MHPPRLLLSLLVLTVVSPLAAQPRFTRAPALTPNPNPRVPLAAVLTFATDGPVVTQVRIADERGRNWDLAFDASHRPEQGLALVGFRSGQRHEVRVTVRDRQGRATEGPAPLAFSAPPLANILFSSPVTVCMATIFFSFSCSGPHTSML